MPVPGVDLESIAISTPDSVCALSVMPGTRDEELVCASLMTRPGSASGDNIVETFSSMLNMSLVVVRTRAHLLSSNRAGRSLVAACGRWWPKHQRDSPALWVQKISLQDM